MVVDLEPYEDLDLDETILDVVSQPYCASCTHVEFREGAEGERSYCTKWDEPTRIKPGYVCAEYLPQGMSE